MSVSLLIDPISSIFNSTGDSLAGTLEFYEAGTNTPLDTYTTSAGDVANANPLSLTGGKATVYGTQGESYKIILKDSSGSIIKTIDNIKPVNLDASLVVYTPYGVGAVSTNVSAKLGESVSVKDFGATGDGVTDDTVAIQAAVNHLETIGGGSCFLPNGTYNLSIQTSSHDKVCLLIPANVKVVGESIEGVIIQRLPSERSMNGVLICNKGYDTATTNYTADGNITLETFTITDGSTGGFRSLGDLIGFGHGDGLIVRNIKSLNHDQHFVDICRSKNVHIYECTSVNQMTGVGTAVYQIDKGLIWGINETTSESAENVYIFRNNIKECHAENIIHFHSGNISANIHIYENIIDGSNLGADQQCIGSDLDVVGGITNSYNGVYIHHNKLHSLNNSECRGINLRCDDTLSTAKNIRIYDNSITGKYRIGIFVGNDTVSGTAYTGNLEDCHIYNNYLNADLTSVSAQQVRVITIGAFLDAKINNNTIRYSINGQTADTYIIEDGDNNNIEIKGNDILQTDDGASAPTNFAIIRSLIDFTVDNTISKHFDIAENKINVEAGANYHILVKNPSGSTLSYGHTGSINRNTMIGAPSVANLYEPIPLSDGTNNLQYVNFGAASVATDEHVMQVTTSDNRSSLPLSGTKSYPDGRRASKTTISIMFAPNTESDFNTDAEISTLVYLSATACAGVQPVDINHTLGTFGILTGVSGVGMVINNSSFQPVIRASGYIKILTGI